MMTSVGAFQRRRRADGRRRSSCSATSSSASRARRGPLQPAELDAVAEIARELGRSVHSARLLETEQRLVSELRELDRYKGELITTISHELKTPLTTIIGHAELLGELHEHRSVEAITRNAERLNRLVQNLLDYSRVQDRRASVRVDVDLVEICRAAIDLVAPPRRHRGGDASSWRSAASRSRSAATPRSSRSSWTTWSTTRSSTPAPAGPSGSRWTATTAWVRVRVRDSGLGISEADQVHLFSAFHRSSNPEALSIPGTGLGLAISRRIVESHGGRIEVESVARARAAPSRWRCHAPAPAP